MTQELLLAIRQRRVILDGLRYSGLKQEPVTRKYKERRYSNGVLIDNWYEERARKTGEDVPLGVCCAPGTTKRERRPLESAADEQIKIKYKSTTGHMKQALTDIGENAYNPNLTSHNTVYYDIIPKKFSGPYRRKYSDMKHAYLHEESDVALCRFANRTKWGLREHKKYQWECEDYTPETFLTTYEVSFTAPSRKDYVKGITMKSHARLINKGKLIME